MSTTSSTQRVLRWVCAMAAAALLASCGGSSSDASGTKFTAVAMAGELLNYTIDTANLTYSYTITESQFGLNGKTGSGTLVRNPDGIYSPSGVPNARIVILPNGLLLGAVRERFGASVITVPIIGLSSPVTTLAALARRPTTTSIAAAELAMCATDTGTFAINANGTLVLVPERQPGAGACPSGGRTRHAGIAGQRPVAGDGRHDQRRHRDRLQLGRPERAADRPEGRAPGRPRHRPRRWVRSRRTLTTAQTDGTWIAGTSATATGRSSPPAAPPSH